VRVAASAVALAVALGLGAAAQEPAIPFLTGRVMDEAAIVPPDVEARIEAELARYEAETGHQVAVLTVPSLGDVPIEDYSLRVAEQWKLGRRGVDDGVLFLVAPNERRMRIEVGYGLEPALTDLESARILDERVAPRFRQGDFGGGIEAGVEAVLASLEGAELPPPPPEPPPGGVMTAGARLLCLLVFFLVVGTFSLSALATEGCVGWGLWAFLLPFYFVFPMVLVRPAAGPVAAGLWLLAFPLGRWWMRRHGTPKWLSGDGRTSRSLRRGGWVGGGGFGGGFGGGGGGGFSGGGGSFGGGGASGSW
jgi:uncharacterized protein